MFNHNDQSWSANPQVGCVTNPLTVPNPLWRTTPPLAPRSLGCQQGHPCRQRVMEEQTSQCCAVHFNPLTPRGVRAGCAGCGQEKMEGQSFRIVCLQMFTLTDTILGLTKTCRFEDLGWRGILFQRIFEICDRFGSRGFLKHYYPPPRLVWNVSRNISGRWRLGKPVCNVVTALMIPLWRCCCC